MYPSIDLPLVHNTELGAKILFGECMPGCHDALHFSCLASGGKTNNEVSLIHVSDIEIPFTLAEKGD